MCTVSEAPDASAPVQLSVPAVMPQVSGPLVPAPSIDHVTPAGSGSLISAPVALPGPELEAVIVNPICEPALTEAASAVLVTCRSGHSTWVVASSLGVPVTLEALTWAVFG